MNAGCNSAQHHDLMDDHVGRGGLGNGNNWVGAKKVRISWGHDQLVTKLPRSVTRPYSGQVDRCSLDGLSNHQSSVNSPHKGQWSGALMFSEICAWINGWVNNREAGDLRRHRAHHDVIVMFQLCHQICLSINGHRNVSNVVVITGPALGLTPQGDRPWVYSQCCTSISLQHIQDVLIRIALSWHHVSTWLLGHEGRSQYPLLRVGRPCSMRHNCAINWHSSWVGWFPQNNGRQGALNRDNTQWLSVHSIKLTVSQQFST